MTFLLSDVIAGRHWIYSVTICTKVIPIHLEGLWVSEFFSEKENVCQISLFCYNY